jgi:hypothetical protein
MHTIKRYTVYISQAFGKKGVIKNVSEERLPSVLSRAKLSGLFPTYEEEKPAHIETPTSGVSNQQ